MKWLSQLFNFSRLHKIYQNAEFDRAMQELRILHFDFKAALKFFKITYPKQTQLPLYLVIGPSKFGKTTLLLNSNLNLLNSNGEKTTSINPTKFCSWYFAKNAVYLDTAGIYSSNEKNESHYKLVWIAFLKLLKRQSFTKHIAGLYIVIEVPTLLGSKEKLFLILKDLRERIYEISQYSANLPIYIVFTKSDLIPGFKTPDFPLGVKFSRLNDQVNPIDNFNREFDRLIEQVNFSSFKELSIQLQNLRPTIDEIISALPIGGHINLAAIYFTNKYDSKSSAELFNNHHKDLISKPTANELSWTQFGLIAIVAFIVITFSLLGFKTYTETYDAINFTNAALVNYEKNNDRSELLYASVELDTASSTLGAKLGLNHGAKINQALKQLIYNLTAEAFISQLQKTLQNEINLASVDEYSRLYNALKTYLMLNTPNRLDKNFVQIWFKNYLERTIPNDKLKQQQLESELAIILAFPLPHMELDQQIIILARNKLTAHPATASENIISQLEKNHLEQNLEYKFVNSTVLIPKIYTKENFTNIYQHEITDIVKKANSIKPDWVIDNGIKNSPNDADTEKLITAAKATYLKNYAAIWEKTYNAITIPNFTNVTEAQKFAKNLKNNKFALIPFLEDLKTNTSIEQFSDKFKNLQTINTEQLQKTFSNLYSYLDDIEAGRKTAKNAYNKATELLLANNLPENNPIVSLHILAEKQPEIIRSLLTNLADNSWQAILNDAQNYLNELWMKNVLPEYQKNLLNNYPLFKDAQNSVTIENFTNFFGPNGTIDRYFTTYLKPFVDTNRVYWEWKQLYGKHLNISQDSLEIFIRAALIQKMFFPNDAKTINIQFTLTPKEISPKTKDFILNLEGQAISYKSNHHKPSHLVWRALPFGNISLDFIDNINKHQIYNIVNSPWAWLKLLDKYNLHTLNNSQHYELIFDLNGNAVKYSLTAEQPINPFIPGILSNFRCFEKL